MRAIGLKALASNEYSGKTNDGRIAKRRMGPFSSIPKPAI
jgi:hypothetical protein